MAQADTIDDHVIEAPSTGRRLLNGGKRLLAAALVVYALHGVGQLLTASYHHSDLQKRQQQLEFDLVTSLTYMDGLRDAGMDPGKVHVKFTERLQSIADADTRPEALAKRDYHLNRAWNPFYSL